jgi:hypothetical protein
MREFSVILRFDVLKLFVKFLEPKTLFKVKFTTQNLKFLKSKSPIFKPLENHTAMNLRDKQRRSRSKHRKSRKFQFAINQNSNPNLSKQGRNPAFERTRKN